MIVIKGKHKKTRLIDIFVSTDYKDEDDLERQIVVNFGYFTVYEAQRLKSFLANHEIIEFMIRHKKTYRVDSFDLKHLDSGAAEKYTFTFYKK